MAEKHSHIPTEEVLFDLRETIRQMQAHEKIADGNQTLIDLSGTPQNEKKMLAFKVNHHRTMYSKNHGLFTKLIEILESRNEHEAIMKVFNEEAYTED